jgi:UDP-2,3-diacylglucosamine pyrophosphatase LpxH
MIRVVIPDSHGSQIDPQAEAAFLGDLKFLDPEEIVMLGDHVDVSGVFATHPNNYAEELQYTYAEDIAACAKFLDAIQKRSPKAKIHYLEGNHELRVEKYVSRAFLNATDAKTARGLLAPDAMLRLKARGVKYYRMVDFHMGLAVRGTIKLGRCYFVHGISAAKNAAQAHLDRFAANVVFGHVHRSQSVIKRTVASGEIGAWTPGTLAKLAPLYMHSAITDWSHGYAIQLVDKGGAFLHVQVPIVRGVSMLKPLLARLK